MNEELKKFIYFVIPINYIDTYKRILVVLTSYGVDMLKDCKANCSSRNTNIVECYNLFISALSAYNIGDEKLAQTIIKYIDAKLKSLYGIIDINNVELKFEEVSSSNPDEDENNGDNPNDNPNESDLEDLILEEDEIIPVDLSGKYMVTSDGKIIILKTDN